MIKHVRPFLQWWPPHENMPLTKDLLHPSPEEEKRKHKKKHLVQSPSSYFMDVKCPGCYKITTVFSHAQTVVLCVGCSTVLCQPTGGKEGLQKDALSDGSSTKSTLYQDERETIPINTFWIQKKKKSVRKNGLDLSFLIKNYIQDTLLEKKVQHRRIGMEY